MNATSPTRIADIANVVVKLHRPLIAEGEKPAAIFALVRAAARKAAELANLPEAAVVGAAFVQARTEIGESATLTGRYGQLCDDLAAWLAVVEVLTMLGPDDGDGFTASLMIRMKGAHSATVELAAWAAGCGYSRGDRGWHHFHLPVDGANRHRKARMLAALELARGAGYEATLS